MRPAEAEIESMDKSAFSPVLADDREKYDASGGHQKYVIETLMKIFGYPQEKSYLHALQIHHDGRGIVWSGSREVAELKRDQIRSAGPDSYGTKKVDFPLGVIVEPLPG